MRIALVTESFAPSVTGVARCAHHVVEHLTARGHEVMVVAPGPGPDHLRLGTPDASRAVEVVRLPAVPLPWCRDFRLGLPLRAMARALRAFAPDLIHLASPIVLGARAAATARNLGVPVVAVYQTDVAGFARAYGWRPAAGPLWRWLRRLHTAVDRTLAPSSAAAASLTARGIPDVHTWGRGVDTVAFSPLHRTRPPTAEVDRVRVGYVGRLATEKRVDRLRHLADLPGIELVVVGDGPRRRRLATALPGATFTGRLGGAALSRAFADLDVFVHTGNDETFCQAAQEALASGVAVVAPAAGGLLDLVSPGRTGYLYDPALEGALRPAVAALAGDPQLRAGMARRARAAVAGRTWEALGDELLEHYRAVLDGEAGLRSVA